METERLLKDFVSAAREAFGPALTGVYLHGSLAMGCFCPGASDVDLIVVTDTPPGHGEKLALLRRVLDLSGQTPGGIEMSVVLRQHCERFVYPTPYELHVSPAHLARALADPAAFARRMHGADRDLAAHFTVLRQRGRTLWGAPISRVFGPVPAEDHLDSIFRDVEDAPEAVLQKPVYTLLNLCRVLAFLEEGGCLSKEEGGRWALARLPEELRPPVARTLRCYAAGREMERAADLVPFASSMLARIKALRAQKQGL